MRFCGVSARAPAHEISLTVPARCSEIPSGQSRQGSSLTSFDAAGRASAKSRTRWKWRSPSSYVCGWAIGPVTPVTEAA
ncbi:hypothetical protein GCM10009670_12910 [Citricoccus alkalitolerans]